MLELLINGGIPLVSATVVGVIAWFKIKPHYFKPVDAITDLNEWKRERNRAEMAAWDLAFHELIAPNNIQWNTPGQIWVQNNESLKYFRGDLAGWNQDHDIDRWNNH